MIKLLNDLKATNSTNEKLDILRKQTNPLVKEAIRLTYDAFMLTYMKKIPVVKLTGTRTFDEAFSEFADLFGELTERKITGNTAKKCVQDFLESCNLDTQDVFCRILQKDLKVKIGESLVQQAYGESFINVFVVQRGEKYDPEKIYKGKDKKPITYWYASPKMDGLRGFYEDGVLRSRGGHNLKGFELIVAEVNDLISRYNLSFADGELFSPGVGFQTLQSYILGDKKIDPAQKEKVRYNIFAIGNGKGNWKDTKEMVTALYSVDWNRYKYITPLKYDLISNDPDTIMALMLKYVDQGYEGAMLRSPDVAWIRKKSNDILKVKPVEEEDFEIIGYFEGTGEIAGTLGGIIVEGWFKDKKGKNFHIISEVGTGFKIKEQEGGYTRDALWKIIDDLVSKRAKAEIQFQNVTDKPDPKTGAYSLRFPVFAKLKLDR